ncbi:hypothetical protein E3P99_01051 [Wallemia hederae]|uniref:Plus3 domain-containing protein n=1 Tax=Wallemia hederae TaxID=1540922 RepID=A0A4T0FSB6_9BASI|nr:hypothetical protein E3P99_01051 [Wallemia hederae]
MADIDNDLDADLLGLVGDDEPVAEPEPARHKPESSDSGEDGNGDDDDEQMDVDEPADDDNPYPLEGKYKNSADRANDKAYQSRLMDLDELEREDILASRQEEMQKYKDSLNINRLFSAAQAGGDDSVASAAKRAHKQTGTTTEKKSKLEELKSKREAKTKKRSRRDDDDDDDDDYGGQSRSVHSDSDQDDGQASKSDAEDNRPLDTGDIHKASISRTMLVDFCYAPFFEDFVKGTFVRYLLGQRDGKPDYRLCEVTGLGDSLVRPYAIEGNTMTNQQLLLRQGKSSKACNMDRVSNTRCTDREFDRFIAHAKDERAKVPTRKAVERVRLQIEDTRKRHWTETDINYKLQKKAAIVGGAKKKSVALEKAELQQRLQLAKARRDDKEADELIQQLASMDEVSYQVAAPAEKTKQASTQQTPKPLASNVKRPNKAKVAVADDIDEHFDVNLVITTRNKTSKLESIIQNYCTYEIEN